MNLQKRTSTKIDSCYFPPNHLIAPEAKNFNHHKRVGDYFLGEVLGEGSFAKTRLGAHVFSGEKVAVKTISKEKAKKDQYVYKNLRREGQILRKVNHPYIIRLLDILETENNYYLITTYCSGGEFIDRIEQRKQLSENEVRRHIRQLLNAVIALHNLGIVHRDLKVENLLLDAKGNLQVIDFGLSNILPRKESNVSNKLSSNLALTNSTTTNKNLNSDGKGIKNKNKTTSDSVESASSGGSPSSSSPYSSNGSNGNNTKKEKKETTKIKPEKEPIAYGLRTQCGSPAYAAPELLSKKLYNEKVDCWSVGIITYALLTGRLPFTVEPFRIQALYRKMVNGDMNSIPSHISSKCKSFILKLLTPDPSNRPSAEEMSSHDWLKVEQNGNLHTNGITTSNGKSNKSGFFSNGCLSTELSSGNSPVVNKSPKLKNGKLNGTSNSNYVLSDNTTKINREKAEKLADEGNPVPKQMSVNKLDSSVIKYMAEKLEFMGSLSDIIENVVNCKPSRALAAYFLFKQKFDREKALFPIEKKLTSDRRKSLVVSLDNKGHVKKYEQNNQKALTPSIQAPTRRQTTQGLNKIADHNISNRIKSPVTNRPVSTIIHTPTKNKLNRVNSTKITNKENKSNDSLSEGLNGLQLQLDNIEKIVNANNKVLPSINSKNEKDNELSLPSPIGENRAISVNIVAPGSSRLPDSNSSNLSLNGRKYSSKNYNNPSESSKSSNGPTQQKNLQINSPKSTRTSSQASNYHNSHILASANNSSSNTTVNSQSNNKNFGFGKRVLAAKRFFEKAPRWATTTFGGSASHQSSAGSSKASGYSDYRSLNDRDERRRVSGKQ